MEKLRVLLVEDDARLAALVCEYLGQHEFDVQVESRGDTAVENFRSDSVDLVILDLMLPGLDGLEVCRKLREQYQGPIMMLTAKGGDIDQVVGLELGADDYAIKPVEPRVLLARVRALLRRFSRDASPANQVELQFGQLEISSAGQTARLAGKTVPLTTQEFDLLWLLASGAGDVHSRDEIYRELRGIEYDGLDRTVDVCVSHLRRKLLDDADNPQRIKTVWGKGYLFVADSWD
jgi:two-component system OmpR family response regulator/two-component system response regulator RstA